MNSCNLVGRICSEVDLRYVAGSGNAVSKFTIAVDRGLSKTKKEEAQNNNKPTADFIRCIVWNQSAEFVANYASKGTLIAVKGSRKINDDRDFGDIFRRALFDSVYRHLTGRKKK